MELADQGKDTHGFQSLSAKKGMSSEVRLKKPVRSHAAKTTTHLSRGKRHGHSVPPHKCYDCVYCSGTRPDGKIETALVNEPNGEDRLLTNVPLHVKPEAVRWARHPNISNHHETVKVERKVGRCGR